MVKFFKGTASEVAASAKTGEASDLVIESDTGNLRVADGSTLLGALKRLVRSDEVPLLSAGKVPTTNLPAATTAAIGALELATNTEVETATDSARAVTPAGLLHAISNGAVADGLSASIDARVPQANTSTQGKVELATTAEVVTGSDTDRAVTPAAAAAAYIPAAQTTTAPGLHRNTASSTYGAWYTFGNTQNSMGFAGTGSPAEAWAPVLVYNKFGDHAGGSNAPITKTTQAFAVLAPYYGPTTDDSAEASSSFVGMKNTGTPYTQEKPVTSFEAIAQVESGNTVSGSEAYVMSVGARTIVAGTAHVNEAYGFKASVNSSGGSPGFGTIDRYVAFFQPVAAAANGGTVTTAYGVYVIDGINSESNLTIGRSAGGMFTAKWGGGADGSTSLVLIGQPTTTLATLSGTYTLSTTPQSLTVLAGASLTAGGGTFMLDSSARTIVTYTSFSGTTVSGATIASGTVATTSGQLCLDPATPNTTALRLNAQRGQSKNIQEWFASDSNLRFRVNAGGNPVTQGTSYFAANGSATTTAELNGNAGFMRTGTQNGPGARLYSGSGAPGTVTSSAAGDFYLRTDTPTTANQRLYVATAANTWTGIL